MTISHPVPTYPGWETVRLIGRGSFGAVYEIRRDVLGLTEKAALKHISIPQNQSDVEELYSSGYDETSITAHYESYLPASPPTMRATWRTSCGNTSLWRR